MARVLRQEEVNFEITGSVGKYHAFQRTEKVAARGETKLTLGKGC